MGLIDTLATKVMAFATLNPVLFAVLVVTATAIISFVLTSRNKTKEGQNLPPMVPYTIPFIGSTVPYGVQPVEFLRQKQQEFGDCFTFIMLGRKMTFCLGPDGNHNVFNVKIKNATAEGAYEKLTVPVFGKEVVYDVHNSVFMEQKKFVKDALTTTAFRKYIPIFTEEILPFLDGLAPGAKPGEEFEIEPFVETSELTIRTASHTLMGKEIRQQLRDGVVSKLYHDLDRGLAPINVFFRWLPLPSYFNRDRAHQEMTTLFHRIIKERRANNDFDNVDVLQALMTSEYKDGSRMSNDAVAHMMIAMLMAGQHTSSTTSAWILFELARRPDVVQEILQEQSMVLTGNPDTPPHLLPDLDYDSLKRMTHLENVMKESLRLHAPIHTVMRKVEEDCEFKGFSIPKGHFLCAAPQVSHLDPQRWGEDSYEFNPRRHESADEEASEWTINGVDIAQKSARSHFLPFGAGRHRCIGEAFAYLQNKAIVALFVRHFKMRLPKGPDGKDVFPETDFTSLIVVPKKGSKMIIERRAH
ncbi:Lanosterol 14-alpha-demethylase [Irineochytrium annulatum]|nr:Lanosterol 14-alpha-demethylase [Irineochytrium annulatum]